MSDVLSMLSALAPIVLVIVAVAVVQGAVDHMIAWVRERRESVDV